MRAKVHFTATELMNVMNPVTVNLIGAGGTGSHLLTCLARINFALQATGRPGVMVRAYDPDVIEQPNIGRANFNENYIGVNKAVAVINHVNRSFGLNWKAVPDQFVYTETAVKANLTICCVDSLSARQKTIEAVHVMASECKGRHRDDLKYLMDFGNSRDCGQVILSTVTNVVQPKSDQFEVVECLPGLLEEFPGLEEVQEDNSPSCSVFEALSKQSLFINSAIANLGGSMLFQMLAEGIIFNRGFFLNLETLRTQPINL